VRLVTPAVCLGLALFLAVVALPLNKTLVWQAGEIIPSLGPQLWPEPWRSVGKVIASDPGIRATTLAFHSLADKPTEPFDADAYRKVDPANGLYDYLALHPLLQAAAPDNERLRGQIANLADSKPARLYLTRRFQIVENLFVQADSPRRIAARNGWLLPHYLPSLANIHEAYQPILRDWAGAMLAYGRSLRQAGELDAAYQAHAAVIRLLTELADESPAPNTMLLASEMLARAWLELDLDVKARVGQNPESAAIEQQAARLADLRPRWHRVADAGLNLLPFTAMACHVPLARSEHQRAMAAVTSALLALVAWAMLLVLACFSLVAMAFRAHVVDVSFHWRRPRSSRWLALLLVVGPCLLLMLLPHVADLDYTWLFSKPSLWPAAALPLLIPVLVALALRLCTETSDKRLNLALWRTIPVLILLAVSPVFGAVLSLTSHGPGVPPAVAAVRWAGTALALAYILVLLAWCGSAVFRAFEGAFSLAAWSRSAFRVTAASFLVVTVLAVGALWLNRQADKRYEQAFVRAAADPVADCLGADWFDRTFGESRRLLRSTEAQGP